MKKQWVKNGDFHYTFLVDDKEIGKMDIHFETLATIAHCILHGKTFEIKRTGFWKSDIEIVDANGMLVLKTYPEKWYASSSVVEMGEKQYRLIIRNNPLAEYALMENEKDVIAYGLATEDNALRVKVTSVENTDLIFDFLLWYLFVPVAAEHMGDDYSFLLLIA